MIWNTTEFVLTERTEALLREAVHAVEATDTEFQYLCDETAGTLERIAGGGVATVGTLREDRWWGKRLPVTLQVRFGRYEGRVFAFYHACGRVVDQDLVRAWLDNRGFGRERRSDMLSAWRLFQHVRREA